MINLVLIVIILSFLIFSPLDDTWINTISSFEKYIAFNNGKQKLYPSVLGGTKVDKTGLAVLSFGMLSQ
jgi:hypothetical protein